MPSYDPEVSLKQLRRSRRTRDESYRQMAAIVDRAATNAARDLWPDPKQREAAGFGAVAAAATFAEFCRPGGEATMLNLVGLFGQYLVDDARAQMAVDGGPDA